MKIAHTIRNIFAAAAVGVAAFLAFPATPAQAMPVVIVAGYAPPPIPVYEQPMIPGDGYLWTPGYWAWGPDGYYWVDGAWVEPPYVGALWTPGWWGWGGGGYYWHPGCWGRTIGYYGGINYGFGYFGVGFYGGYWGGGRFWYNRAYTRMPAGFHAAVYERSYAGFSGRPGGASFNAHPPAAFAGVHGEAFNHASGINGGARAGFAENRGSVAGEQRAFAGGMAPRTGGAPQRSFAGGSRGSFGGGHVGGGGGAPRGGGGHR